MSKKPYSTGVEAALKIKNRGHLGTKITSIKRHHSLSHSAKIQSPGAIIYRTSHCRSVLLYLDFLFRFSVISHLFLPGGMSISKKKAFLKVK